MDWFKKYLKENLKENTFIIKLTQHKRDYAPSSKFRLISGQMNAFFKFTVKDLLLGKGFCWTSCSIIELFYSGFLWESDGISSLPPNMGESAHCPLNQFRNSMNYQMGTFTVQHLTTTWCSELNHTLVDLFIVGAQSGFIIRGVKSESSANCKQIANHPSYPNSRCYCPVTAF